EPGREPRARTLEGQAWSGRGPRRPWCARGQVRHRRGGEAVGARPEGHVPPATSRPRRRRSHRASRDDGTAIVSRHAEPIAPRPAVLPTSVGWVPPNPPGVLTGGWRAAVVRGVVAVLVVRIVAELFAFLPYFATNGRRPSVVLVMRLGGLLFYGFHHVGVRIGV